MRVFIAGVIQGGLADESIHDQGYRVAIAEMIGSLYADAEIVDPHAENLDRLSWSREQKSEMFLRYAAEAARCDVLVAWLPQPSMGTAVEMYQAHLADVPVLAVSPLHDNWTIFSLATRVFPDLAALASFLSGAEFRQWIDPAGRVAMTNGKRGHV